MFILTQDKAQNGPSKISILLTTWKLPDVERLSVALLETSELKLNRSATAGNLRMRLTMQIKQQPPSPPAPSTVDGRCAWWGIKIVKGGGGVSQKEINATHALSWRESLIVQLAGTQTVANAQA